VSSVTVAADTDAYIKMKTLNSVLLTFILFYAAVADSIEVYTL